MATLTDEELASARVQFNDPELKAEDAFGCYVKATANAAAHAISLSREQDELKKELTAEREAREAAEADAAQAKQEVELSRGSVANAPDPEVLKDRADNYLQRIDIMVDRGDMPNFVAAKLKARVMKNGVPSAVMLSRAPDDESRPIDFDLSLFDGSKLGIATGAQLSRSEPTPLPTDGKSEDDKVSDERLKTLREKAGVDAE